jgi:zona occludens toxin (predicted ATPase)
MQQFKAKTQNQRPKTILFFGGKMRYYISLIAIAVIGISIFTACSQTAPTMETAKTNSAETPKTNSAPKPADPLANVPRITLADAKKAFDAGNVVFVDTRAEVQFRQERVKNSINIPAETFEKRYAEVPKDKQIITYCS